MFRSTHQTQYTSQIAQGRANPQRDMRNRKPYRTVRQKAAAKIASYRTDWGHWTSAVAVSHHP